MQIIMKYLKRIFWDDNFDDKVLDFDKKYILPIIMKIEKIIWG